MFLGKNTHITSEMKSLMDLPIGNSEKFNYGL